MAYHCNRVILLSRYTEQYTVRRQAALVAFSQFLFIGFLFFLNDCDEDCVCSEEEPLLKRPVTRLQ